jgi:hypothetical protein
VAASNSPFKAVYQLVGCLINFSRIGISIKGDGDVFSVNCYCGYVNILYFVFQVRQEGGFRGVDLFLGWFCYLKYQLTF